MATANLMLDQRTEEWRQARCGKVTGSLIADVLSKPKKGSTETAGRANYRAQIIAEILTGKPCDDPFISRPMQWGIDHEPEARVAYEMERDLVVEQVGFVDHPRIENFGCSPDGLVGEDGMVQFKCPHTATHIGYLLHGEVPAEYQPEMLCGLSCCPTRQWCDFVSFDPRLPRDLQLFVKRFWRDEARIAEIESKVEEFLAECKDVLVRLSCLGDLEAPLRKSLELAKARRGPQAVVSILDRRVNDEVQGAD
jgi:hypothetical protein